MRKHFEKILDTVPDNMAGTAKTAAIANLFKICDNSPLLDDQKRELFHSIVAKLLFICKRGRPDIQTVIAFLCTRVKCATIDDYLKLTRCIQYL